MLFEDDFALSDGESSDNVDAGMRCSLKTTSPSLMARAVTTLMLGRGYTWGRHVLQPEDMVGLRRAVSEVEDVDSEGEQFEGWHRSRLKIEIIDC